METLEPQTAFENLLDESQSYRPASLANPRVLPGSDEAKKITVGSGRQLSMLLNSSSQLGRFSKILLESSRWTSSEEFCHVWQVWDTRYGYSAFRLIPLEPSTDENECSLLPTPRKEGFDAQDGEKRLASGHALQLTDQAMTPNLWPTPTLHGNHNKVGASEKSGNGLATAAKLWPTPTVPNGGRRNPEGTSITGITPDGKKRQIDLREFALRTRPGMLYPTITASQKSTIADWEQRAAQSHSKPDYQDCSPGSLNPRFVEELMGFPIDHTALSPSGTQSFRSKRSRSSKRSTKSKAASK